LIGPNDRIRDCRLWLCNSGTLSSIVSREISRYAKHVLRLPDAMGATDRLRFDRRIPPRIEQKDVLRGRQVQAQSARFQADQETACSPGAV